MKYNIGDVVLVGGIREAVITDRIYSAKSDKNFYSIRYTGDNEDQEDLYNDEVLKPFTAEKVDYEIKAEISEGVVIFSVIEIKGGKRSLAARGHGHMLRNDLLGILQAASYAAKKAFTGINGGETYIEKEN